MDLVYATRAVKCCGCFELVCLVLFRLDCLLASLLPCRVYLLLFLFRFVCITCLIPSGGDRESQSTTAVEEVLYEGGGLWLPLGFGGVLARFARLPLVD